MNADGTTDLARLAGRSPGDRVLLEVEEALGPGVELEPVGPRGGGLVVRRARRGGVWMGVDRAVLSASDDGRGRQLPVLVALPGSTFAGCRIEGHLIGGFQWEGEMVLVATVPGAELPIEALLRTAARIPPEASTMAVDEANRAARQARVAFRERSSHARLTGGRAWRTPAGLSPEAARWSTPYSLAEYRLDRLPPRFLRGLDGLLDDDERLVYAIERRPDPEAGLVQRLRRPADRRAALFALTDRQALWLVDHADPGAYLMDWGVDVDLVAVERLDAPAIEAMLGRFPPELAAEVGVGRRLMDRFASARQGSGKALRRRYGAERQPTDPDEAGRFGQAAEAISLERHLEQAIGPLTAFLFSPRRPGQRSPAAVGLGRDAIAVARGDEVARLDLAELRIVRLVLSPLSGRLELQAARGRGASPGRRDGRPVGHLQISYPAPFGATAAGLVRRLRRHWADVP
jgi:hypothetical protein